MKMDYKKFDLLCEAVRRKTLRYGALVDREQVCNVALWAWAKKKGDVSVEAAIDELKPAALDALFSTISRNLLVSEYRKVRRQPKTATIDFPWEEVRDPFFQDDEEEPTDVRKNAVRERMKLALRECLDKACPITRQAVLLKWGQELTSREIGQQLSCPPGAIDNRLCRFRRRVRQRFQENRNA